MPGNFLTDYKDDLSAKGTQGFLAAHPHPVLIVKGLAGRLTGAPSLERTIVAEGSNTLTMGQLIGRVFPLVKGKYSPPGPISVGRTNDNDIAIAESSISKRHCLVGITPGEMKITDLGSTNGTIVNGVKLEAKKAHPLCGGEALVFGRFALVIYRPTAFMDYLRTLP